MLLGGFQHSIGHQIIGCENSSGSLFYSDELAGTITSPQRHKIPFHHELWIGAYTELAQCLTVALIAFLRDTEFRRSLNVCNTPGAQSQSITGASVAAHTPAC